jgi:hypothetical protein
MTSSEIKQDYTVAVPRDCLLNCGSLGIAVIVPPAVQLPPELAVHHGNS